MSSFIFSQTDFLNTLFKTTYQREGINNKCACSDNKPLPLSKKNNLNTSTNKTQQSARMTCAQAIQTSAVTQPATIVKNYNKKTCSLGGPTFSY